MEKRDAFVKRIDARDYIEKSARKERQELGELTNILNDWGMQLCDIPKEELDRKYEELARKYYCSEPTTILDITKETIAELLEKDRQQKQNIEER